RRLPPEGLNRVVAAADEELSAGTLQPRIQLRLRRRFRHSARIAAAASEGKRDRDRQRHTKAKPQKSSHRSILRKKGPSIHRCSTVRRVASSRRSAKSKERLPRGRHGL